MKKQKKTIKEIIKEVKLKRICVNCEKETLDTPCPYCGGGVFRYKKQNIKVG